MNLYNKENIIISTIEEGDIEKVIEYFSENTFNCNYENGSLRPTNAQFRRLMEKIVLGEDDENNVFVLKKDNEVIGYEAMFVEYDRLHIGHIAVKKSERGKGYGELLTKLAILVAENEDRDVVLFCNHVNKYLPRLNFTTNDGTHYMYRRRGIKTESLPRMFVSVDEYRNRKNEEMKRETDSFASFLRNARDNGLEI